MAPPGVQASKAQAALARIMAVISTVPPLPHPDAAPDPHHQRLAHQRAPLDLRLRLGPSPDDGIRSLAEGGGGFTACSGVVDSVEAPAESSAPSGSAKKATATEGSISYSDDALTAEKSSRGEREPEEAQGRAPAKTMVGGGGEKGKYSNITDIRAEISGGHLDLLLEAVQQVSGGYMEEDEPPDNKEAEAASRSGAVAVAVERSPNSSRGTCWTPPALDFYEDCGPVVRSKRGRNQALPSRYRDSILDPWGKMPSVAPRWSRLARQ